MNKVEKTQIANGFTALNCEDGFRKDNSLWFGECSECGERISNSHLKGIWEHTLYSEKGYFSKEEFDRDGMYNFSSSRQIDYCPKVKGETNEIVRWYKVDGEKFFA